MQFICVCLHSMPRCSLCKKFYNGENILLLKTKTYKIHSHTHSHTDDMQMGTSKLCICRLTPWVCSRPYVDSSFSFLTLWYVSVRNVLRITKSVMCQSVCVCVYVRVCVRMSEYVFVGNMRQGCVQWMAMNYMRLLSLLELFSYLFDNRSVCRVYSCIHIDNNGLPPILMGIHA